MCENKQNFGGGNEAENVCSSLCGAGFGAGRDFLRVHVRNQYQPSEQQGGCEG